MGQLVWGVSEVDLLGNPWVTCRKFGEFLTKHALEIQAFKCFCATA